MAKGIYNLSFPLRKERTKNGAGIIRIQGEKRKKYAEALIEIVNLGINKLAETPLEGQERIAIIAIYCESIIAGTACLQSTSQGGGSYVPLPEKFDMPTFKQLPVYNRYKQLLDSLEKSYRKIIQ